jgi:hypothetical protein
MLQVLLRDGRTVSFDPESEELVAKWANGMLYISRHETPEGEYDAVFPEASVSALLDDNILSWEID